MDAGGQCRTFVHDCVLNRQRDIESRAEYIESRGRHGPIRIAFGIIHGPTKKNIKFKHRMGWFLWDNKIPMQNSNLPQQQNSHRKSIPTKLCSSTASSSSSRLRLFNIHAEGGLRKLVYSLLEFAAVSRN